MTEEEFAALVDELSPAMLRMARVHVRDSASAEDVVQEAWIVVIKSLDRFEGRSKLSTWIFGIVINIARRRGVKDARSVPFSGLPSERFHPADHPRWPGHWAIAPTPWPQDALERAETLDVIRDAIAGLPASQREVITMRDVLGYDAQETCNALGLTGTNQRVLLHRARTKVRAALEEAFDATERLE
ncbi:MAG TPA: sigma-70 family RNA polymerase sigma factor [Solirubrobacteraceae bacterium]